MDAAAEIRRKSARFSLSMEMNLTRLILLVLCVMTTNIYKYEHMYVIF